MSARKQGAFGRFAAYYDFIYHDLVNYEGDVAFLESLFRKTMRPAPSSILDLGCGTGNHDLPLARRGYEVTGLDLSEGQLAVARRKARSAHLPVHFIRGNMRSFRLDRTFDAVVCMFGAFGYLTTASAVAACLRSVRRHLRPQGLLVFEFWHTSGARSRDDWIHKVGPAYELVRLSQNHIDWQRRIVTIDFRFFVFRGRRVLDRFDETHRLRMYSIPEMRAVLDRAGFDLVATYSATNVKKGFRRPTRDTFRVMAVARLRAPKQS